MDPAIEEITVVAEPDRPSGDEHTLTAEDLEVTPGTLGDPVRAIQSLPGNSGIEKLSQSWTISL